MSEELVGKMVQWGGIVGLALSALFESITMKWHGKDIKKFVFAGLAILVGGGIAIIKHDILLPNMDWSTGESTIQTLVDMLGYGVAVLAAGLAWFKSNFTKRN